MKLRNKKTEEVKNWCIDKDIFRTCDGEIQVDSLAELNEEWEDYAEPEELWYITADGDARLWNEKSFNDLNFMKEIGNYFETEEEAEKAVEKLKAWKRLKDSGLTIKQWRHTPDMNLTTGSFINIKGFIPEVVKNIDGLDLLFGGEE